MNLLCHFREHVPNYTCNTCYILCLKNHFSNAQNKRDLCSAVIRIISISFVNMYIRFYQFQFSIQILVTMLTIFGNLTIILCVTRHKNLQRPSHFFIASLATTDLFLGLTVMVPRLTDEVFGGWYFGYLMCQV